MGAVTSELESIKIDALDTHLMVALLAVTASHVRVPHWTHAHQVTHLQVSHFLAHLSYLSHDLVSWTAGVRLVT